MKDKSKDYHFELCIFIVVSFSYRNTKTQLWSIEQQIELRDLFRRIKDEKMENIGLKK